MIIGLTGLTGAGKSTAAELLKKRGYMVIDCDKLGHKVTSEPKILEKIKTAFGEGVINPDGSLNRKALGKIVFSDSEKLKTLNSITHPAIKAEVMRLAEENSQSPIAVDGAVLKESGIAELCSAVIRVTAPKEVRLRRIMERDALNLEEAEARISAQTCGGEYIDVDNGSTLENLEKNLTEALWETESKI